MFIKVLSYTVSTIGKLKFRPVAVGVVMIFVPLLALVFTFPKSTSSSTGASQVTPPDQQPDSTRQISGTRKNTIPEQSIGSANTGAPAKTNESTPSSKNSSKSTPTFDFTLSTKDVSLHLGETSDPIIVVANSKNKIVWTTNWSQPGDNPEIVILSSENDSTYNFKIIAGDSLQPGTYQLSILAKDSVTGATTSKLVSVTVDSATTISQ